MLRRCVARFCVGAGADGPQDRQIAKAQLQQSVRSSQKNRPVMFAPEPSAGDNVIVQGRTVPHAPSNNRYRPSDELSEVEGKRLTERPFSFKSDPRNKDYYRDPTPRLRTGQLDGTDIPTALYKPLLSTSYPARQAHWQAEIDGVPQAFRGKVVVVGETVCGITTAILFAQRGWQVACIRSSQSPMTPTHKRAALLSKRGMDVLDRAGLTVETVRKCGAIVSGRIDNPGTLPSAVRVPEENPYSVNLLSANVEKLRQELIVKASAYFNLSLMLDHRCVAIHDDDSRQVIVQRDGDGELLGQEYDLVVAADGAQSSVRTMLDIETEISDNNFRSLWFTAQRAEQPVDERHIHCYDVKPLGYRWAMDRCTLGMIHLFPQGNGAFAVHIQAPSDCLMTALDYTIRHLRETMGMVVSLEDTGESDASPTVWCRDMYNHRAATPSVVLVGTAARSYPNYLHQMLNLELEDVGELVHQADVGSTPTVPVAIALFSRERGLEGDCLYKITRRSMYYSAWKNINLFLRLRTTYLDAMHTLLPRAYNEWYQGNQNFLYPRSINAMMNGRGYASYHDVDQAQLRINRWYSFARLLV